MILLGIACPAMSEDAAHVRGTFIQLTRANARMSSEEWGNGFDRMRKAGVGLVIVQWSAVPDVAFVKSPFLAHKEQFDTIARILEAAAAKDVRVYLGLGSDPEYWTRVTARDVVLRDYFLTRVAENARLQAALLSRFKTAAAWVGYYIPDEIDDLNWRIASRRRRIHDYIETSVDTIRGQDPGRKIGISAFFRARTAPHLASTAWQDIVRDTGIDHLLLQDGVGEGDPPEPYSAVYLSEIARTWRVGGTDLWGIVEAFERTSPAAEPFAARPAPPERLRGQVVASERIFGTTILFTFSDYLDPVLGGRARVAHGALVSVGAK